MVLKRKTFLKVGARHRPQRNRLGPLNFTAHNRARPRAALGENAFRSFLTLLSKRTKHQPTQLSKTVIWIRPIKCKHSFCELCLEQSQRLNNDQCPTFRVAIKSTVRVKCVDDVIQRYIDSKSDEVRKVREELVTTRQKATDDLVKQPRQPNHDNHNGHHPNGGYPNGCHEDHPYYH